MSRAILLLNGEQDIASGKFRICANGVMKELTQYNRLLVSMTKDG